MSKKKLLDAEMFADRLRNMSHNMLLPQINNNLSYSEDPLTQAIYDQINMIQSQMNNNLEDTISDILLEISLITEACIYQDHPCRLCQDTEDDPIENFGDIRTVNKITNS